MYSHATTFGCAIVRFWPIKLMTRALRGVKFADPCDRTFTYRETDKFVSILESGVSNFKL